MRAEFEREFAYDRLDERQRLIVDAGQYPLWQKAWQAARAQPAEGSSKSQSLGAFLADYHARLLNSSGRIETTDSMEMRTKPSEHDMKDKRCECCGYMTYQREHMGCIRAAAQPAGEAVAHPFDDDDAAIRLAAEIGAYDCIHSPNGKPELRTFMGGKSDADRRRTRLAIVEAAIGQGKYTAPPAQVPSFQKRVQPWMMECFGPAIASDREERNHRFLEEALELVQACGCTASEAHQLVDYVYGRPVGDKPQEVGGVMVTLAALCLAQGLDMHECGEIELARIWTKVEKIRAKQAAKPKHSPLPEVAPPAQVPDVEWIAKLRHELLFAPMKSNFTMTRDELIQLLGGVSALSAAPQPKGGSDTHLCLSCQRYNKTCPLDGFDTVTACVEYRPMTPPKGGE